MSDEQNTNQDPDTASTSSNGLTSSLLALKENNPKVFFGAIGGILILIAIVVFSGGSNSIPSAAPKNLVIGQKYSLKNPNAYEVASPIRLVSVPGAIAAYDDSEDETKKEACRQIQQGTAVLLAELQDAYGKKNVFSKVKIEEGECKGSEGWVLSIDVQ